MRNGFDASEKPKQPLLEGVVTAIEQQKIFGQTPIWVRQDSGQDIMSFVVNADRIREGQRVQISNGVASSVREKSDKYAMVHVGVYKQRMDRVQEINGDRHIVPAGDYVVMAALARDGSGAKHFGIMFESKSESGEVLQIPLVFDRQQMQKLYAEKKVELDSGITPKMFEAQKRANKTVAQEQYVEVAARQRVGLKRS